MIMKRHEHSEDEEKIIDSHGDSIRYCSALNSWYIFDSEMGIWRDNVFVEHVLVNENVKGILESMQGQKPDIEKVLNTLKNAVKDTSKKDLNEMMKLSKKNKLIPHSKLDSHEWFINCVNGTLDLRTNRLKLHDIADFITSTLRFPYEPESTCPLWMDFLDNATNGDEDLIETIQKALGYSLTGNTKEQCMFLLLGKGTTGKKVFLSTVYTVLCEYSIPAKRELFKSITEASGLKHRALMKGKRFVVSDQEEQLERAVIEKLISGKDVMAKLPKAELFNYKPSFKMWMRCNNMPFIESTCPDFKDRIKVIPFDVTIPESERDVDLQYKLITESKGIFAWMVRGCMEWQRNGL